MLRAIAAPLTDVPTVSSRLHTSVGPAALPHGGARPRSKLLRLAYDVTTTADLATRARNFERPGRRRNLIEHALKRV
jgi:hypothetical protein